MRIKVFFSFLFFAFVFVFLDCFCFCCCCCCCFHSEMIVLRFPSVLFLWLLFHLAEATAFWIVFLILRSPRLSMVDHLLRIHCPKTWTYWGLFGLAQSNSHNPQCTDCWLFSENSSASQVLLTDGRYSHQFQFICHAVIVTVLWDISVPKVIFRSLCFWLVCPMMF